MDRRSAGLLLHPTSLWSPHGVGDLGDEATRLLDWMARAGLQLWQMLPIGPVGTDGSPYSSWSSNLGNPLLIDLRQLVSVGLVDSSDIAARQVTASVNFERVRRDKLPIVHAAARRLLDAYDHKWQPELAQYRVANPWVVQAALFSVIRSQHLESDRTPTPWWRWPVGLRQARTRSVENIFRQCEREIDVQVAVAFLFDQQWHDLRRRAQQRGVALFGDMPIYVGRDSVDVWAAPERFQLGPKSIPTQVAGVPPDAFSELGQLWGNPLYDWHAHAAERYAWWRARLKRSFELFDVVRVDHFRAFAAYWSVPMGAEDAREGAWVAGPGAELFEAIEQDLGHVDIVAEDLGTIDDDVCRLLDETGLPGMEVLQFAFDGDRSNNYLPHNHRHNAVAYVGTHDNDTALGW
ncbi:MAG TPA: 4-alpha-glucanotransferase, partial [Myxococcales bacterium]|nr:4-alpha-glucanotransferase [Myxococcales bacterium]